MPPSSKIVLKEGKNIYKKREGKNPQREKKQIEK